MFIISRPYNRNGEMWGEKVVAIQFPHFINQLTVDDTLLAQQGTQGRIPALAVLEHIVSLREKEEEPLSLCHRVMIQQARSFLEKERFIIRKHTWQKALADRRA